ncbi:MAG: peptidyl-prolyl cis-trans isomerase SurA [Saprospiraceae bacterium]|jgi:peptidyl-prolyl cis-trans isomerase SurA
MITINSIPRSSKALLKSSSLLSILAVLCIASTPVTAQNDEGDVLFDINGVPVHLSEFQYIYEKNNRDNADYSKASVDEYLDLYINFKLKVRKAKDLGYADTNAYKEELAGYRKQLADSYVIDKEVIERIADETLERKQYDVAVYHILITAPQNAHKDRVSAAKKKIDEIRQEIIDGLSFEEAAARYSHDRNSNKLGGDIGYLTASLPDAFIELEDAIYSLPKGELSQPIKTDLGYHIVKILDKRPARGTMEAAHILLRKTASNGFPIAGIKERAANLKKDILEGKISFDDAAVNISEDKTTSSKNGYLGFLGIGQFEASFEDVAFAIATDGAISDPVETSIGWHIIKRISKRPAAEKSAIKESVRAKMQQGKRFDRTRDVVVKELQKEANFKERREFLQLFSDSIDNTFFDYSWQVPDFTNINLFSYNGKQYGLKDFAKFAKTNSKTRLRAKGNQELSALIFELYDNFVAEEAISYAESHLEERYLDFKNLMREYEEGILLFEITKNEVWDKAASDSLGLAQYYGRHSGDYNWTTRVRLTNYSVRNNNPNEIHKYFSAAKELSPMQMIEKFNAEKELVMYSQDLFSLGAEPLRGLLIEPNVVSVPQINNSLKMTTFKKIEEILPAGPKKLKEAKGYVISDYQDELEEAWIEELKKEYKVNLKKKTLRSIIKS